MFIVKTKIVFFSRGDDKFLNEIIDKLSLLYEVKKITVRTMPEMKLIDQWMAWADICWFEWCDGLVVYASKLDIAKQRKVICRLHSYEAFTLYPSQVNWESVDILIFVSMNIKEYLIEKVKINKTKIMLIPNGVNMENWTYKSRVHGYKIAYAGYINYKKGPLLLLQTFKALFDRDNRYSLHIAAEFQDPRYSLYFKQMVVEMGLENNFIFDGWQESLDHWLDDKDYILCTSVLESQNMGVMQAMAKGIKPVIHNFAGAKGIYDSKYIWNTIDEAIGMVADKNYDSAEYRDFIQDNYSFEKQFSIIENLMDEMANEAGNNASSLNYIRNRMNSFAPYSTNDFNKYDLSDAKIVIGKRERVSEGLEFIEFIINNNKDEKLIINNIWYNPVKNAVILPEIIQHSTMANQIRDLIKEVLEINLTFQNNMAGFIFDKSIEEDVRKNALAYIWERGIPASQFLPLPVYLRIIERYIFAGDYIKEKYRILEAPCGFGYGAAYFSKLCGSVEALDIAEDNIEFCKNAFRFKNVNWIKGDVTDLLYNSDEFDVYVSYEVFEHLPVDTAIRHIEEAYRVLKKGGVFILSTPNRAMRTNVKNPFHVKEYEFEEFSSIIGKVFNSVEFYSMSSFQVEKEMKDTAFNMIAVCKK